MSKIRSMRNIVITGLGLLSFSFFAKAQRTDTTLKGTTVEVIQSYKPEVRQAPKPIANPELPPRDTSRPRFEYEVPQQTLYYTYSALPLRPLALGKDTSKLPFPSYVKLGVGNFSTKYLDAGIANFKGADYETAIHLHHLSQTGNIKNQKISLSGIEAEGILRRQYDHTWKFSLEGLRNQYHYFGYDHILYDFSRDSVKQTFTGVNLGVGLSNDKSNKYGVDYTPNFLFSVYKDDYKTTETSFLFDLPITKQINQSWQLIAGLTGAITTQNFDGNKRSNNIFKLTPALKYYAGNFSGRFGLFPAISSINSDFFFLPDIDLRYKLPNTKYVLNAGVRSSIRQNTYKELSGFNPYILNLYGLRHTRTYEVFGEVQTSIGEHVTVSGGVGWWQFNDLPMFLNDSTDRKNFIIVYDEKVNAALLQATVRYQVANTLNVGLSAKFINYYKKSYDRVWHEPGVNLKGELRYNMLKKLSITGYATILDRIYAINEAGQEIKLDGVFDIGGGAEYEFISRLSGFLNINNLLNDRYQRWNAYESFGFNIYAGVRFKF